MGLAKAIKRGASALLIGSMMTGLFTGCSATGENSGGKLVKIAVCVSDQTPAAQALADVFKPMVEEATDGRYDIQIYNSGVLGSEKVTYDYTKSGIVEMCVVGTTMVMAGEFMNRGGITKRIVNAANAIIGHVRGGLGYVAIMAILLFASMIGSAVASTAFLGAILIPMMVRAGYKRDTCTGLIAAGNILSPIMPPSVPMIIFGVQAGVSVTKLFMGGIAPAVYLSGALCVLWFFIAKKDNLAKAERQSAKQVAKALLDGLWALILPVFILVGLRSGKFTPTEAGVIAAVYALVIGLFVYKELKISMLMECLVSAAKSSSVIMFLAAAAMVSSWMMTVANVPSIVTGILAPFIEHPVALMLIICLIVLLVGTSMDVTPTIMILTPVLLPAVKAAGIDVAYFGVVFILMTVLGLLTPPVGTVLNVACGAGKINMERMVKSIWPFLLAEVVILLLMVLFPSLVTVPMNFFLG